MGDGINCIVNVGDMGKPADTLIRKISSAIGGLCRPWQIKRIAQAEADAKLILEQSNIEAAEMQLRAMRRFVGEESNKQRNIESITSEAIPLLHADSNPDTVDDDWIVNFFDKCKIISNDKMQKLWAKILAGEVNSPGKFSRRTINLLSSFDQEDAKIFTNLCRFIWRIDRFNWPLLLEFPPTSKVYLDNGIIFGNILHLESIGLIKIAANYDFKQILSSSECFAKYFENVYHISINQGTNSIDVGYINLTSFGLELSKVITVNPVDGFEEYVLKHITPRLRSIQKVQINMPHS
ncbi:MAG: DUF2806 domain-containing protein [Desulfovibrio aminophilus]|uniref:DUF2806 domain-containing protein n=1 Tax=Desulfovibrio aminophilus TaxID=81425 RepID=UPI0039EA2935